jgi:carbamoyltransferase
MIILGIHDGHGSSAALISNGKVIAAAEEERFRRQKGYTGYPSHAINWLKKNFPESTTIDFVAVATKYHDFSLFATQRYPRFSIKDFLYEEANYWVPVLCRNEKVNYLDIMSDFVDYSGCEYPLEKIKDHNSVEEVQTLRKEYISAQLEISSDRIHFVDHHTCHAHHAYYSSPLRGQNVLIATMDGFGDDANASISIEKADGSITCLYQTNLCNIGRIYQFITLLLGMKPAEHEFKVMGLAAYCKEHYIIEPLKVFEDTYYVDKLEFRSKIEIKNHYQYFKEKLEGYRFDAIAGALQRWVENLLCEWIKNWLIHTNCSKLVFSGGVALNIKACKKIAELNEVDDMFICLAGGDESISIGAAQKIYCAKENATDLKPIKSPYLSAGFTEEDIQMALDHPFVKSNYETIDNISPQQIAEIIANGNVVALMSGKMEFGPRALGNRSLLADPRNPDIVDTINIAIKNRDFWMPFTPSILKEMAEDYLINIKELDSPYMTMAFEVTEKAKKDIPAAIHAHDLTARPQLVDPTISPYYYDIIKEFCNLTGVGALLNTSFNIHSKPIVHKPLDAVVEVLMHELVELDYVIFENTAIKRI